MVSDAGQLATTPRRRVAVTVTKDSMTASIILREPPVEDPPITVEEILEEIEKAEITYGLDRSAIEKAVEESAFNEPITVAKGIPPKRGENSQFAYHFDTSHDHRPDVDRDGRIDYKNIHFVQNIEKGGLLVSKTPPTPCIPGYNVYGKPIKGVDGRDIPFKHGINTVVSEDGMKLLAAASGAIIYLYGKVAVNDVMTVKGDVDFNVGNIDCRGSVRVQGGIKTGFELKIDGDLEVNGNVEDCDIDVKGNIMIKGGFFGKGEGKMRADGDIFLKYAEGQRIEAGGDIYVGGEVINCRIIAGGNVWVKGKKGKIVGGDVKAYKEIKASFLGSNVGTVTRLAVAYDAALMQKYEENVAETKRLQEDMAKVKEALYTLYRQQIDGKLSPQQQEALGQLEKLKEDIPATLDKLAEEMTQIEDTLAQLEGAAIIAEDTLYPGVRAAFGIVYKEILKDAKKCRLKLEGKRILVAPYE
ncbi:MAG: FapA family protein [Candidatus Zixiibacteriota bacterium]